MTSEGLAWTWGSGAYGKLGRNDEQGQLVPQEVAGELGEGKTVMLVQLAAGYAHTMVLTHDGALWGCG